MVDDEEYRKLEAELAKRTGGLFTETDEQLPQSLRRAKEKVLSAPLQNVQPVICNNIILRS